MLTSERREKKQGKIRNSEYYGMESIFDTLYAESRNGKTFNHLMAIIESEENIKLAYRTIKRNHGSKTPGVDKKTIRNLAKLSEDEYVRLVKKKFSNYHPRPVRREEIPKDNGKTRPLGIPAISDRIVQQCILQVMEPICEAKFSENSNGFRPNRSAETAIAQCCRLIQVQHLYHVVDLDIKGFFDNINHTKLIRQIWSLGIRDKKLLCIIKQMQRNNLHDVDTWMFFKYFVKMWIAVYLVSHTFDIAMAVFDIGQSVVNSSSGIIRGNTAIDISSLSMQMQAAMATMAIGELVTLALETLVVSWCLKILSVVITVIMYGRMIEIYLYTSLAPIPFATMSNREWGHVGTNYFRGLFALAFQAFLMMVCVAIYAALIGSIRVSSDIHSALFGTMAYTVILCFSLLKTGSLSKQIFGSH